MRLFKPQAEGPLVMYHGVYVTIASVAPTFGLIFVYGDVLVNMTADALYCVYSITWRPNGGYAETDFPHLRCDYHVERQLFKTFPPSARRLRTA